MSIKDLSTEEEVEVFILTLSNENARLKKDVSALQMENEDLKHQIQRLNHQLFGKKSEKQALTKDQPNLPETVPLFDEAEGDEIEVEEKLEEITYRRRKKRTPSSAKLGTLNLPRRCEIHDLLPEEKQCRHCHQALTLIGEDKSEKVEIIPQQQIVVEHIRKKYACRCCDTVVMGDTAQCAIPKALGGNSLLAKVAVDKYAHHLPIYRQSKIYEGQGFIVPDSTLGRWLMQMREVLAPIGMALWEEMLTAPYLQIDETPVQCLAQKNKAYMWVYSCFEHLKPKIVLFDYQTTRGQIAVNDRMENFKGKMQTDAYGGYTHLRSKDTIIGFGCGAHIRRKFVEAAQMLKGSSGKAQEALKYFEQLYEIEEMSRSKNCSAEKRYTLRQEKSKPILASFHQWLLRTQKSCVPKSPLGKAISYALNEWRFWSRYVEHGEVEIDNNWVENQIRPFALGRRNWLFIGNQEGGETSALFYSLLQSCRLNQLDGWSYLFYVLGQVHALRKGEITARELLPHRVDPKAIKKSVLEYMQKMAVASG